jgi:hypothetical protein
MSAISHLAPTKRLHQIWNRIWPQAMIGLGLGLIVMWIFFLGYGLVKIAERVI